MTFCNCMMRLTRDLREERSKSLSFTDLGTSFDLLSFESCNKETNQKQMSYTFKFSETSDPNRVAAKTATASVY